jgi:CCR4-NOT transcription complex subunit 1
MQQQQQQQQQRQQNMAAEQPSLSDAQALPNIQAHARVHPQPNVPESVRAMLARFLPIALTHGIREIVSPVVERSATIACVTSRELVRKDFACDPDTSRLRKAAHAMVSSLAGSLALATSREPLKASAANQLRLLVQRAGASNACEAQALENAIQNAVQDNLELGCSLIEKAATEKAMRDVDEALAPAVVVRRQHKETQQQQPSSISAPFYDSGVALSGKFPAALQLETLRPPRPGSATLMSGVALKVYDDFSRIPRLAPPTPMGGSATSSQSNKAGASSGGSGPGGASGQQPPVPQSAFPGSQPPLPGAPPPPQPPLPGGPPPPSEQSGTTSFLGGGKAGEDGDGRVSTGGVDDSNLTTAQKSAKEMRERVASHFDEWARVQDLPPGDDRSVMFLQRLERTTFLREDAQEGFLRVLVELAVTHCLGSEKKNQGGEESSMSFAAVDAYCRLVTRLARRPEESPQQRLALFGRALVAIVRTAMRDTDERGPQFNPKPYFRALSGLLNEMRAPDAVLDSSHPQVLAAFASALLALQPMRVPGFAFAWLELVSHRCFMPRLLLDHAQKGRPLLQRLICAALKFLEPYLRECNLTEPVKLLYKGVLRVFLVLLHDFPEFLCDNHVFFLDATPTNCVQLRNLVLSAFPRNMRLPDPFTPNLKIDLLPEISQEPTNAAQFVLKDPAFNQSNVKVTIDNYLSSKNIANASQVANQVRDDILLPGQKAMQTGTRYDVPMMNALALYVGVNAIVANQNARNSVLNSSSMELLQKLCDESLDAEGRYYFMSAVANQLRYPNSHTHYFSCVTLCLFQETKSELVREQITRVLLERLVVNRPHPWGLLVTFVELIKNPRYNFWAHGFTRCAPEIERLFESVARSCVKSPDEGGEAGQGQQQDGVAT